MEDISFKNNNPGAVKYGNYINYYQFHPAKDRLELLPTNIWDKKPVCHALDLGCNAGDLTFSLHQFLKENVSENCYILGVDIDSSLIARACEKVTNDNIEFIALDFMDEKQKLKISEYQLKNNIDKFDVVFCYSITMWIHLNHGDDGLKKFLRDVSELGAVFVIEPQPWKCYRKALKRMKAAGSGFPLFYDLKIRKNVEEEIEKFLVEECKFRKVFDSDRACWERKTMIFKSNLNPR